MLKQRLYRSCSKNQAAPKVSIRMPERFSFDDGYLGAKNREILILNPQFICLSIFDT